MPLVSDDPHHKNQLASDWMHKGIDLLKENSAATLEQAVRCFDEAIALRRTLPLEDNPLFRYGLSAGWINRGDALARLKGPSLAEAVKSYDEALTLLETLPLEANVLYPRRLAITWINRGMALQSRSAVNDPWEAMECFREALAVLEHPSAAAMADRASLLAAAWTNLAAALMDSPQGDVEDVRAAARKALALIESSERTDLVSVEIGLKARHLLCRLAVKEIANKISPAKAVSAETTTIVDGAMALVRHWNFRGQTDLTRLAQDIFRFGCRIYESCQPHSLAEFLTGCLAPDLFGEAIPPDQETLDAARAAIWGVLGNLQLDGFGFVATPHFQPFLADIQALGKVEERLNQLRDSSTL